MRSQSIGSFEASSDLYLVVRTRRVPEGVILDLRGGSRRVVITYDPAEIKRLLSSVGTVEPPQSRQLAAAR
jgi:hypothetical protein